MDEEDERQVYTGNSWWKTWKHPINKLRERERERERKSKLPIKIKRHKK